MSTILIRTNFNIDLEFEAAPFYKRLLALILDFVVMVVYYILAYRFLTWAEMNLGGNATTALFVLLLIPFLAYHLLSETLMNGQSVGKKIMGIRVVNEYGGQPSIGQYVIRWLIRTSDYNLLIILVYLVRMATAQGNGLTILWQVGVAFGLFILDLVLVNSKKQQRLGDILAHTLVISARQRQNIDDTIFLDVAGTYTPSFPQVMQLSDRDINSLKSILDTSRRRSDYHLAEMASQKIKSHLKIDTTLSPYDFLEVLLKDYNYLSSH
jgi:uncharacterized RDD family membrane protein YckC